MARNVQQVFNKVIKDGYYPYIKGRRTGMCLSLERACRNGAITHEDQDKAEAAINGYLRECNFAYLSSALEFSNLPHDVEAALAIYKNWKCRPKLAKRSW